MILSKRVRLGGVNLDEVDESIVIRGLDPGTPEEDSVTGDKMGGFGLRLVRTRYRRLEAGVTFAIDIPKREMARRREVFDAVLSWVQKRGSNWLVFEYMPKRRMYVDQVILPNAGDVWDWTAEYTIRFIAYYVPFWESNTGDTPITEKTVKTDRDPFSLEIGGTAPSVLDILFKNISGKTNTDVTIKAGGNTMTFKGVNLADNECLMVDHTRQATVRARAVFLNAKGNITSSRNVYPLLSGADDLVVEPGTISVDVKGKRTGQLTVTNFARWL